MEDNRLVYYVALGMVQGVGSVTARKLIEHTGDIEAVFREPVCRLRRIHGIGELLAPRIRDRNLLPRAAREVDYMLGHNIRALTYLDDEYPARLNQCPDAPIVLYMKGQLDVNPARILSVVGTRDPSDTGLQLCRRFIKELAEGHRDAVVVSGLAYGIDICAHQSAMKSSLKTLAVLGHGFRHMYPALHRPAARRIEKEGALLTEFNSITRPERNNFIRRNRIIAGISDATLVVQSGIKGGALTTARMAGGYNREVFAVPGRIGDRHFAGCNNLIKTHRAHLAESSADIEYILGWERKEEHKKQIQYSLVNELNQDEQILIGILSDRQVHSVDSLCTLTGMAVSKVSSLLLKLEFTGMVYCLPGNSYRLCVQ